MAGTDDTVVAAGDEALYILTAVLLTPAQFPSVLGDDYPEACGALGIAPDSRGYGLVLGQDEAGARWTVVVDDVSLVAVAIASWDCGMEYELSPGAQSVVDTLPGWPLALAVAAPGVPEPHDPVPGAANDHRPALTPPDTSTWGPAQRRLGADEIALQWAAWREQIDDTDFDADASEENGGEVAGEGDGRSQEKVPDAGQRPEAVPSATGAPALDGSSGAVGGTGTATDAGIDGTDSTGPSGFPAGDDGAPVRRLGIRRVLTEARAYVDAPPPLGRVRSAFAPGGARMLRADGPGWSMVARTDDIAFVLLDEEPGEILPVGRGPELPGLLEALDRMAVRPA